MGRWRGRFGRYVNYAPPKQPTTPPEPSVKLELDLSAPTRFPVPPDAMAVAHWLGTDTRILWFLILNRKKLYKTYPIPKPHGGKRLICDPGSKLKWFQNMALHRVLNRLPVKDYWGAYEKGRGVAYTSARHAGHKVILEFDIKDFFGSTTRKYVRQFFYGKGWPEESAKLMADLLTYPVKPTLSIVPQGAPSSPTLCNLIADERFDTKVIEYLSTVDKGWVYTRYSDNLFISHPENRPREEVDAVLGQVKRIVKSGGYFVHPKKVHVMRSNHKKKAQHMLGLTVNKHPNIPDAIYRKLRAQIDRAYRQGFDAVEGCPESVTNGAQAEAYLRGLVNYYHYISPTAKMQKLKDKLEEASKKAALARSAA